MMRHVPSRGKAPVVVPGWNIVSSIRGTGRNGVIAKVSADFQRMLEFVRSVLDVSCMLCESPESVNTPHGYQAVCRIPGLPSKRPLCADYGRQTRFREDSKISNFSVKPVTRPDHASGAFAVASGSAIS